MTLPISRRRGFALFTLLGKAVNRILYPIKPYWTSGIYGFGKWIRRYGYYPPVLPLCIYTDHGPGDSSRSPYKHELESDAPTQFYHSLAAVERWKKASDKPCYQLFSPFVFARRLLKIERSPEALGSIFFPSHNTESIKDTNDTKLYIEELSRVPDKYLPVTICMHITDIHQGLKKEYESHGYRVVTAGDSLDQRFIERFYNILSEFRYALSNEFGSYGLYSIEIGIPFGLYGSKPKYFNESDLNFKLGIYECYMEKDYYKEALRLFNNLPGDVISDEQKDFAKEYLGMRSDISRSEMSFILYKSFGIWFYGRIRKLFEVHQ